MHLLATLLNLGNMAFRRIGLILLGVLAGELALILGTTIAQEVIFDGISFYSSDWIDISLGGLLTILAAVGAGYLAGLVGPKNSLGVGIILTIIVLAETIYLQISGITEGPVWFDLLAGLGLVGGIWLGVALSRRRNRSSQE